jgi:integrase
MRVTLIHREGRPFIEARWVDPITGKKRTKSTGTKLRREAERFAARLEADLRASGGQAIGRVTWSAFVARYDAEVLSLLSRSSRSRALTALRLCHEAIQVQFIDLITPAGLSAFATSLQTRTVLRGGKERPVSSLTICSLIQKVKHALMWAFEMDLLAAPPKLRLPKRIDKPKGRAISGEEFDRMMEAVPRVMPAECVASWQQLLKCLWWGGLRLGEALRLHWTSNETGIVVDMTGPYVMLRIWPQGQKSRRYQLLPVAREFAEMLRQVPEADRRGLVFQPRPRKPPFDLPMAMNSVSRVICQIGKVAGVRVGESKSVSAHDLRRSFGTRWARHVTMSQLRELMRHASIQTTAKYYLSLDSEETAKAVQDPAPVGNTFGNSGPAKKTKHRKTP